MTEKSIIRISIIGGIILIIAILFITVVFGGAYNIGAINKHPKAVEWVLETTMKNSVKNHAKYVEKPDSLDLTDRKFYRQYYKHYTACITCHGAPGKKPDPWMATLYPSAPALTKKGVVSRWTDEEIYWILSNGIQSSGMIALGPTHAEKDVWGLTAFVKNLPNMTPQEYKEIAEWYDKNKEDK